MVSLASYWPELVPLLKDDETLSDIVCDDLLPCDAQDYDSICWNCASNFLPSLSSLPPDSLIDESVAFLGGNAYCQSGGFNLPDNCTESVSKMVTFALPVVMSTWAEPDTAERYCSGLTCEYLDVTGETALMLDSMHHLMTGSDEGYDENVFTLMEECINFFNDSDLFKVNDANWGGIHQYADSWGVPGIDEYPPCPPNVSRLVYWLILSDCYADSSIPAINGSKTTARSKTTAAFPSTSLATTPRTWPITTRLLKCVSASPGKLTRDT